MSVDPTVLRVIGYGRHQAEPSSADLQLAIVSEPTEPGVAFAQVRASLAALQTALADHGIDDVDIHTSQVSLQGQFDYTGPTPRRTGFEARITVAVQCRDLARLQDVLSASAANGAVEIQQVSYRAGDPAALSDAALVAAVQDGTRRAHLLAQAAGITVGPLVALDALPDMGGGGPMRQMAKAAFASDSAGPLPSGELDATAAVTMAFEIGRKDQP